MKVFAQFYTQSSGWNGKDYSGPKYLVPACGSDGYLPLDGRLSLDRLCAAAEQHARKLRTVRKHHGFQICRGEKLSTGQPITPVYPLQLQ